jgi:hypothetical protein
MDDDVNQRVQSEQLTKCTLPDEVRDYDNVELPFGCVGVPVTDLVCFLFASNGGHYKMAIG